MKSTRLRSSGTRHAFVSHFYRVDTLGQLNDGRAALTPDPIAAQVQCDAVKPGRELGLTAEAFETPKRPEEGLLNNVTGFFFPAQCAEGERVDWPLPAGNQLVETVQIPHLGQGYELFIRPGRQRRLNPAARPATAFSPLD